MGDESSQPTFGTVVRRLGTTIGGTRGAFLELNGHVSSGRGGFIHTSIFSIGGRRAITGGHHISDPLLYRFGGGSFIFADDGIVPGTTIYLAGGFGLSVVGTCLHGCIRGSCGGRGKNFTL